MKGIEKIIKERHDYRELLIFILEELNHLHSKLVNIGAPLNDNKLRYNKEQLAIFRSQEEIFKNLINQIEVKLNERV